MSTNAREIGQKFLGDIDIHLKENIQTLSCNDIHRIYFDFFEDLKKYKGNSNNFTGLSEYLIFRSMIHSLGESFGVFHREDAAKGSGAVFVPASDKNLCIGNNMRIDMGQKRHYPDIGVKYDGELVAVAQIKLYLTNGAHEIDNEASKIETFRNRYGKMKAMLIIFQGPSKGGSQHDRLIRLQENKIGYVVLKGESRKIRDELCGLLPESITKRAPNQAAQYDAKDGAR